MWDGSLEGLKQIKQELDKIRIPIKFIMTNKTLNAISSDRVYDDNILSPGSIPVEINNKMGFLEIEIHYNNGEKEIIYLEMENKNVK